MDSQPLSEHGIFILPSVIDETTWVDFLKFTHAHREHTSPLRIICNSNGGYYRHGVGICQMIAEGNYAGYLIGKADSAAGLIFSSCQRRYAAHGSVMGVHGLQMEWSGTVPAADAFAQAREMKITNRIMAGIYAGASTATVDQWYALLTYKASMTCFDISYADICRLGMAEPMPEGGVFHERYS